MTELTRVRFEARGETKDDVRDQLMDAAHHFIGIYGTPWEEEPGEPEIIPAKTGFWGHLAIRRIR